MPAPVVTQKLEPRMIGIVGSRRRTSDEDFRAVLAKFDEVANPYDAIVSGGCPTGADAWAQAIAKLRGRTIMIHYPKTDSNGQWLPGAQFKRNGLIARDCDILIACVARDRTGGTEDTIRKAANLGKPIILV